MSPDALRNQLAQAQDFPDWTAWLSILGVSMWIWILASDFFRRRR